MIVKDSDIVDRVRLRQRFMSEGLGEIMAVCLYIELCDQQPNKKKKKKKQLKSEYPDDELQEQLAAFDEELENDLKDVGFSKDQFAIYEDPSDIITPLWESMVGSGLEKYFISVLRHLHNIGVVKGPAGQQIWAILGEALEKFDKFFEKEKLNGKMAFTNDIRLALTKTIASNITLEETLISFLGQSNRATENKKITDKAAAAVAAAKAGTQSTKSATPAPAISKSKSFLLL